MVSSKLSSFGKGISRVSAEFFFLFGVFSIQRFSSNSTYWKRHMQLEMKETVQKGEEN